MNAENAEEEAGEASDALATAKQDIKRLRAVLSTNDAAKALEAATLKVLNGTELSRRTRNIPGFSLTPKFER